MLSLASEATQSPQYLVVIGSSAGGIEALSAILSVLPTDFDAPIVVAQHLDPARPSNLAHVLERKSALPVVLVEERVALEAGKVYVVPSNRHIAIEDGHVTPELDHQSRPRPSIDHLLSTAAERHGERLVAVILSGHGSDGAAGAVDVKAAGGTVVIQNPSTARYASMPMALPPTIVDHVVDADRIAALLTDIVRGAVLPETQSEDAIREVLGVVGRQTNLDFVPYKRSTILRRIGRRMAVTHNATIEDYRRYLENNTDEVRELVMAFLIKVTEFFRDGEAFEFIRERILPQLIDRARHQGRTLRFWSAGCATGEEPYSLALLVADMLGAELPEWNVKIFATDLDEGAIAFARRGLYPTNLLRTLPDDYRGRFFEATDAGSQISKALRQMVIFGQQDISRGVPFPRIDLVLCRNLLIYFKPELQQRVLDLFAYSLHQGNGYLFLGKAETPRPSKSTFELMDKRWKVYRCTHGPMNSPRPQALPAVTSTRARRPPQLQERPLAIDTSEAVDLTHIRRFTDAVLRAIPNGIVVIDRSYRILSINGAARRLLGIRDAGVDGDFLHAARGIPYGEVRTAIDSVFRERTPVALPDIEVDRASGSNVRYLALSIMPLQVGDASAPEVALVSVSDQSEAVQTRRRLEAVQAEQMQLVSELSSANKRLSEVNKDLQDANEELQAANEEMMLTQEELQAANEELEATNEELQATNEELETNNEELQATNEELEATNDELTARTHELQEVLKTLASERLRLGEMIELAPFYILVLRGPGLTIEACNPKYAQLLAGRDYLGRPVDEVFRGPELTELLAVIRDSYWKDVSSKVTIRLRSGADVDAADRELAYTVVPMHDAQAKVEGVVVYAEELPKK